MAAKKPQPKPVLVPEFTAQDYHNIVQLLNRVQTNGIQEAQVLLYVAGKCAKAKDAMDPNSEVGNGEDVSSTDE